jgi:hypothetical protein
MSKPHNKRLDLTVGRVAARWRARPQTAVFDGLRAQPKPDKEGLGCRRSLQRLGLKPEFADWNRRIDAFWQAFVAESASCW